MVVAALVLLSVATVAIAAATRSASDRSGITVASSSVSLTQVPQGVSVQQFGDRLAFVVRDGSRITAFDTDVHHLPDENVLWWCPNERVFVAPTHGETFSRSGRAIGGPATSGLDRLHVAVHRDELVLTSPRPIPGSKGNRHTAAAATRPTDAASSWDSGPGSFCSGALEASNAPPTTVLDVEALATLQYDKKVYDVPAGLVDVRLRGAAGILFTFDDARYRYCLLATDQGATHSCRVYPTPGDYLVDDAVPGHRQVGLEATIRVTAAPVAPSTTSQTPACAPPAGLAFDARDGVRVPATHGTIWARPFALGPPKVGRFPEGRFPEGGVARDGLGAAPGHVPQPGRAENPAGGRAHQTCLEHVPETRRRVRDRVRVL